MLPLRDLQRAVAGALTSGDPGALIGLVEAGRISAADRFGVYAANREGALVAYGRCDEELAAPYGPFTEALGHVVELAPMSLLEEHVAEHGAEVVAIAPALLANPCTVPCTLRSVVRDRIASSDGHRMPLPTASSAVPE